jgi:uncharacterized membrane protein YgaE (UPF0421/DUF939 family)
MLARVLRRGHPAAGVSAQIEQMVRAAPARERAVLGPALQAALAAGVAWYVAHDLLGHHQPFFAPIAAAVALSTSHIQRSRRTVQMVVGVLLGIGVAELLRPLVGDGAISIAVVVLVTLLLAVAIGVGFVGQGMMFVNQAAASAILVIALHRAGTGGERATDALVGGAVALIIGVGLFPADPLKLLWRAERDVLGSLLRILERRPRRESPNAPANPDEEQDMDWPLAASHDVHRQLTALTQARDTARVSVRVAPRRMPMRAVVEEEERRVARLYLLVNATLDLMRTTVDLGARGAGRSAPRLSEIRELADTVRELYDAPRPWQPRMVEQISERMRELERQPLPRDSPEDAIIALAARRVAQDVVRILPLSDSSAWRRERSRR